MCHFFKINTNENSEWLCGMAKVSNSEFYSDFTISMVSLFTFGIYCLSTGIFSVTGIGHKLR